jgi:hypothetical protein
MIEKNLVGYNGFMTPLGAALGTPDLALTDQQHERLTQKCRLKSGET